LDQTVVTDAVAILATVATATVVTAIAVMVTVAMATEATRSNKCQRMKHTSSKIVPIDGLLRLHQVTVQKHVKPPSQTDT